MMITSSFICRVADRMRKPSPTLVKAEPSTVFLKNAILAGYLPATGLISCYHESGSDQLAKQALMDFGHEQLSFKLLKTGLLNLGLNYPFADYFSALNERIASSLEPVFF